jgi:hypothetical protein
MDEIAYVLDGQFETYFSGDYAQVLKWLEDNPEKAKSLKTVAMGKDFQIVSIGEFKALHG